MHADEVYMRRCLQLAALAAGNVAPNPMVGAVLVHNGSIIGEGYHQEYGGPHAEVNCINSVPQAEQHLIAESTMYVSLEPCAHYGKTPPCADLIIKNNIRKVVIGCRDPFEQVYGKGIEKLKAAGVEVVTNVLEDKCRKLNKRFFTFHEEHRPYIILKWAETADKKIAAGSERLHISNQYTNRLVHQWRSEEQAILVGTNTALMDDPELTTRLWPGKHPIRLVVDMQLKLPQSLKLFTSGQRTIVFNLHRHTLPLEKHAPIGWNEGAVQYYQVTENVGLVPQVLHALYHLNLLSVMVEGGAYLLQSFIDEATWDEARVITNEQLTIGEGLPAPDLKNAQLVRTEKIHSDRISYYRSTRRLI